MWKVTWDGGVVFVVVVVVVVRCVGEGREGGSCYDLSLRAFELFIKE